MSTAVYTEGAEDVTFQTPEVTTVFEKIVSVLQFTMLQAHCKTVRSL